MAFTYDPTDLDTSTTSGKLNTVRLLVGDTDSNDPQVQDNEISFALSEHTNIYSAAAFVCRFIAAKYARLVTTQLDGALQANYSDLQKQYVTLEASLKALAKTDDGNTLGVVAGGISLADMALVELNADRNPPAFKVGQFDNLNGTTDDYWGQ